MGFQKGNKISLGIKRSKETREKIRLLHLGRKRSEKTKRRLSEAHKGQIAWNKGLNISGMSGKKQSEKFKQMIKKLHLGKKRPSQSGENHWNWKKDRSLLKKEDRRGDSAYVAWRREVWQRDSYKCKMNNQDCLGRIEAHHILSWSDHPNLRYENNNGITLCRAHHPKKRAEEKKLASEFKRLIQVSKAQIWQ